MSLEIGIGVSSQADVSAAGQEAAEQVMSHLADRRPDLVFVFSSIRFADPRMLKAVRSVTGQAPLIGCTDAGGIMTSLVVCGPCWIVRFVPLGNKVSILCDGGGRYASKLFNPAFLRSKNLPVPEWLEAKGAAPKVFVE